MNQAGKQVLEILMASERLADQVLQNKQEIVELDKRRQSTREAIRDIGKNSDKKVWITVGPILVKMEKQKAHNLLKKGKRLCPNQLRLQIQSNACHSCSHKFFPSFAQQINNKSTLKLINCVANKKCWCRNCVRWNAKRRLLDSI